MKLILRMGWRNLWRNTRRSVISVAAVAAALVILVLMLGLAEGLKEQMLTNGTSLMLGEFQIHDDAYLPDKGFYDVLGDGNGVDVDELMSSLEAMPGIEAVTPRVNGFALLSTGNDSAGAQLMGLDPVRELRVTTFLTGVVSGEPLGPAAGGGILLGEVLARELKAAVGDEVAAVTQAADGSMGNDLYIVRGTIRTGLPQLDRFLAIFHYADLQQLVEFGPEQFHEIAGRLERGVDADAVVAMINSSGILPPASEARSWGDLIPSLRDYLQLFDGMYGFFIGLVGLFAALGILNTMLMAVFERTREIGMLAAMGMAPSQIVGSIVAETVLLVALGLGFGLMVSALLMQPLSTGGLDLSRWMGEMQMMQTRMDPVIYLKWNWDNLAWSIVGLAVSAFAASIFPSLRAARLDPVEALGAHGTV